MTRPSPVPRSAGNAAGPAGSRLTRRRLLLGAAGAGGLVLGGAAGWALLPGGARRALGMAPEPYIPDAPEGRVRLETVLSTARGRAVELFTAVPAGHGDGAGLPVVVVLHGASATAADFGSFGLARFLTAAVAAGSAPFVLAGADGGVLGWEPDPDGADDPQRMVLEELPSWLAERGFDADTRALWGWSMGGYGALRAAEVAPGWARAVAAFSPALSLGGPVFAAADALRAPVGLWCGTEDDFYDAVVAFADALPVPPRIESYSEGGHTRVYWNAHTLAAFDFLSAHLEGGRRPAGV